jgi:hypothetical protein
MNLDFVSFIHPSHITVHAETEALRECISKIGGIASQESELVVNYSSVQELVTIISMLQKLEIPFSDQLAGWPPAAVFDDLKEKGIVTGNIKRISWLNANKYVIS